MATLCSSTAEVRQKWASVDGSCETGAMIAAPLLKVWLPNTKFLVIRRDTRAVIQSLHNLLGDSVDDSEVNERAAQLDKFAADNKVPVVAFEALQEQGVCEGIYAHLTGRHYPQGLWERMRGQNIQVEILPWMQMLIDGRWRLSRLKAEVRRLVEASHA